MNYYKNKDDLERVKMWNGNGAMRRIWKYVFINRNGRMNGNIMNIETTIESKSENGNSVFHLLNYFDKL